MLNKQYVNMLGFAELSSGVWRRQFSSCEMRIDFNESRLIYPEEQGLVVNERQTCNFSAPENFVVFECVCRLLFLGYQPQSIELEPKWKVGHGASGGRADIIIKDKDGNTFLIIECKTCGTEFEGEWRYMQNSGGQLFTYARQTDGAAKFIVLYTSAVDESAVKREYKLIALRDKGNRTGETALFAAWKELYGQDFDTIGVFEDDCEPYEIGKTKRTTSDLQELAHSDIQKKYHEFATILRKYNVSGRENAFDKLVNLFLAKIVDEANNSADLMFAWKNASDTYYTMIDRIQRLYRDGMQKFLNEEVTYIENSAIEEAFRLFKDDPDATRDTILKYFRQLKFYTNNDFAFLDVHNEHLFFQNSVILREIVRMLQDIKLKTEEQNQFLGDLFEGFLDQGVKQSEGQFFTPMPIVKFLVSSLPLEQLAADSTEPLRVIDYACGAGHFLNEYAAQIRAYVEPERLRDFYAQIVGIEKEYRLSKVAKVSAFMYGQDDIKIVYADALAANEEITNGTYNILVSNPPYSVRGFLETLTDEERAAFGLTAVIDDKAMMTNNSIETFFVERAKQLLAPKGVAAIILPSSILSNGGAVYTKTREIILQYFDVTAIAEFGSGTFGKTGTNTITLFLRRKADNPTLADHYRNRVAAWFKGDFKKDKVFKDADLLAAYCEHIGLELDEYKTLLTSAPNEALLATDVFTGYRAAFDGLTNTRNLQAKKWFKQLTAAAKAEELLKRFVPYARKIEQEKLYYFMLAYTNQQNVVVVKTPAGTTESKKFLGYEWSGRKGDEGIKYLDGENIYAIETPLFDPNNLNSADKINTLIRGNFNDITVGNSEFVTCFRLVDMLDFSGVKFEKTISLTAEKMEEIVSRYPVVVLGTKCDVRIGGTPARINSAYYQGGTNLWVSIAEMAGQIITDTKEKITDTAITESNCKLIPRGTTLLSFKLSIGKTAIAGADLYTNEAIAGLIPLDPNELLDAYLFHLFNSRLIDLEHTGFKAFGKSLNSKYLKTEVKIPLPPLPVQQEIVAACKAVDEEYNRTRMSIEDYRAKIERLFGEMEIISRGGVQPNR
jgi:type I restriction-modification system DNA methylase subunit